MVKIIIMSDEDIFKKTISDIENRRVQTEDYIIYLNSMEDFRRVFTKERIRLLSVVRETRPDSLYQLAQLLGRDFKSVQTDARLLQRFRLLHLDEQTRGLRPQLKPTVSAKKIQMEMAI